MLVFPPLIARLRERGDEVELTAREYAQTLQLLELHGLEAEVIGRHGGRSRLGKARSLVSRERALRAWAKGRGFDLALAHGSHDLTLHRPPARHPERDDVRLRVGVAPAPARLPRRDEGRRPRGDPARAAEALRRGAAEAAPLPGSEGGVLPRRLRARPELPARLGVDPARVLVVLRTPPDVSLYHRHANPLFPQTLDRLGRDPSVHAVVLPRTDEQREYVRSLGLPSVLLPERAVDAQSLIAAADLVVSAGGTMNREAVALGVPVYTTFGGRLGGVDEALIREGRLTPLSDPAALELRKREAPAAPRVRRDPQVLLDLLLSAAGQRG